MIRKIIGSVKKKKMHLNIASKDCNRLYNSLISWYLYSALVICYYNMYYFIYYYLFHSKSHLSFKLGKFWFKYMLDMSMKKFLFFYFQVNRESKERRSEVTLNKYRKLNIWIFLFTLTKSCYPFLMSRQIYIMQLLFWFLLF